jgi:hypothetical protein
MNRLFIGLLLLLALWPASAHAQVSGSTQYPGALDNSISTPQAADNKYTSLTVALTASASTVTVASTTGFPTAGLFYVGNEQVQYTGTTATTFTGCTRGASNTVATEHPVNSTVREQLAAPHVNGIRGAALALEAKVGVGASNASAAATGQCIVKQADGSTAWATCGSGTSGTVTSVGVSAPSSIFSVSGSPVTTNGTINLTLQTQAANRVFAGPASGADAQPSFRALVADDIPALDTSKLTTGALADARIASAATWNGKQNALGYTPLNPSNNLSDVAAAATARSNLGLGTAATRNVPPSGNAASTEAVIGSDTRLTDARTPLSHTHTASQVTDFSAGVETALGNLGFRSLRTNLAGYWKLDEASGNATDSTGASTLTDINTVTSAAGKRGTSRQFTHANNEYFSAADSATLSTGDISFTISAWVYLDSKTNGMIIVAKDDYPEREFILQYDSTIDRFVFFVFNSAGASVSVQATTTAPSLSTWYHLLAWHDAEADTINIQVNNSTIDTTATAGLVVYNSTAAFTVGGRLVFGSPNGTFDGRIDELLFTKRVLWASQRTDLYNSGLALTYPF